MTNHSYLLNILEEQNLDRAALLSLTKLKETIHGILQKTYGSTVRIYYGGSFGKNTVIKDAYDLDIVIYFPSTVNATLRQIYEAVHKTLVTNKYFVIKKNVALRLPYKGGFHIDVVPGKAQDSTFNYATLYKNETDSTIQTSLKKHIDEVQPVKGTIRLVKVWKLRNGVDWETFALEQTVVRALKDLPKNNYETNLLKVFGFIVDKIENIRLEDPANTNNEIKMSMAVRCQLKADAQAAIDAKHWSDIIY